MSFSRKIFFLALFLGIGCSSLQTTPEQFDEHWKNLVLNEQKPKEAQTFCERWVEHKDPQIQLNARICLASLATIIDGENNYEEAIAQVDEALKIDPKNMMLFFLRINLDLHYKKDFSVFMTKTLENFTDLPADPWLDLLGEWFQTGQHEQAIAYLKILDAHYKDNPKIMSYLGMTQLFLGDIESAEANLGKTLKITPDDVSALWGFAKVYETKKDFTKAKGFYEKALAAITEEHEAYTPLHCLYTQFLAQNFSDTQSACKHAKNYCPEFFESICTE